MLEIIVGELPKTPFNYTTYSEIKQKLKYEPLKPYKQLEINALTKKNTFVIIAFLTIKISLILINPTIHPNLFV